MPLRSNQSKIGSVLAMFEANIEQNSKIGPASSGLFHTNSSSKPNNHNLQSNLSKSLSDIHTPPLLTCDYSCRPGCFRGTSFDEASLDGRSTSDDTQSSNAKRSSLFGRPTTFRGNSFDDSSSHMTNASSKDVEVIFFARRPAVVRGYSFDSGPDTTAAENLNSTNFLGELDEDNSEDFENETDTTESDTTSSTSVFSGGNEIVRETTDLTDSESDDYKEESEEDTSQTFKSIDSDSSKNDGMYDAVLHPDSYSVKTKDILLESPTKTLRNVTGTSARTTNAVFPANPKLDGAAHVTEEYNTSPTSVIPGKNCGLPQSFEEDRTFLPSFEEQRKAMLVRSPRKQQVTIKTPVSLKERMKAFQSSSMPQISSL